MKLTYKCTHSFDGENDVDLAFTTGWLYYGQAFAIETEFTRSKNPLSHDQLDWLNDFAKAGGQYIEARTMDDVRDALGREEPQPWKEYEMRVTKVK